MRTFKLTITEDEQGELSDCVIAQIQNANKAKELISDERALKELDNVIRRLSALNVKLCSAEAEVYSGEC